jgi:NET1-associated nuclear protein 1 (U3 small nucleolar RNA-associated protein 17)
MISGGSENVLVHWQVDTGKKNFLPHLSGTVENITVSDEGSSFSVHLDDNSAMILSTAELKPTFYISGLQSTVRTISPPKDMLVTRVWTAPADIRVHIPAALSPMDPSRFYLCVGSGQQATTAGETVSTPLLQTFDLENFRSICKQPLARTQPTDVNFTAQGHPISEPRVTHIAFSHEGNWLATVDEWQPPSRDLDLIVEASRPEAIQERREIHLKFWEVRPGSETLALSSRINSPHITSRPETVLDLVASPKSTRFATLGTDGVVRIWRPKLRLHDGVFAKGEAGEALHSWSCSLSVNLEKTTASDALINPDDAVDSTPQGKLAVSEDGSTLFAAYGDSNDGTVYVIDMSCGVIRTTLDNMWTGSIQHIQVLSSFVITLSDDLRVFDIVSDELQYGMVLPKNHASDRVRSLSHLAADPKSGTFALAIPDGKLSRVAVFTPEDRNPLMLETLDSSVLSLIPASESGGFIALDDAAQIQTIMEDTDGMAIPVARPLEDMNLAESKVEDEREGIIMLQAGDESGDEDTGPDEMDIDDNETSPAVISQQKLAEIFDAAPAFAQPAIEDIFYQVTALLSVKPPNTTTS